MSFPYLDSFTYFSARYTLFCEVVEARVRAWTLLRMHGMSFTGLKGAETSF